MKLTKYISLVILFGILFGITAAKTNHSRCPKSMVLATNSVCIDQFEWPNKAGIKPKVGLSGIQEEEDKNKKEVWDAERLCKSVGKRVCTSEEWISACEGIDNAKYPFGNKIPKYSAGDNTGLCNYDKKYRDVDEYLVSIRDLKQMKHLNQSEPAGHRKTCKGSSGAFDMMGNAEEWVRCKDGTDGWCLAGRYWAEPRPCRTMVRSHSPKWHYYDTSTRCCVDIKEAPSTTPT